ncbi:MAG: hemerythrin [Ignavibacteriae bacterium]|nr:MAG: hemerythrin [Ignavibacteriota bacterium]
MSELINNSRLRVDKLKELILKLHKNKSAEDVKKELTELMGSVPYGEVVQAEEELISEGLEREEVLKFCDIHTEALKGNIDTSTAKSVPEGHPIDTFIKENNALQKELDKIQHSYHKIKNRKQDENCNDVLTELLTHFTNIMDIEKHYVKKENLLFPFLEKYNITGPPMVMWGKHDEIRSFLKSCMEILREAPKVNKEELEGFWELMFFPAINGIQEMFYKEEKILFPMSLDTLTEIDWYEIYEQSDEIGFTLFYPENEWKPNITIEEKKEFGSNKIKLSTGAFSTEELEAMLNSIPQDITFVDKDDKVRFFSHGKDRIFERNKAILGREVQYCHPPSSVHIVNKIVDDFKSGRQDEAVFWINFGGKLVHIAYYAVRNNDREYLGTIELTQDITKINNIEGERRLLTYDE